MQVFYFRKLAYFIGLFFCSLSMYAQEVMYSDSQVLGIAFNATARSYQISAKDSKAIQLNFGINQSESHFDDSPIVSLSFGKEDAMLSDNLVQADTPAQGPTIERVAKVSSGFASAQSGSEKSIKLDEKSITYSLFIGVSDYQFTKEGFGNLDKPVADATSLRKLLVSKYQFTEENSWLLENPNKSEILKTIEVLARKIRPNDNLLIFYAGHGYWDDFLKVGYWLANDAKIDDKSTWLSNSNLRDYITAIPSKHTLLVTDACFAGGIFKTRSAENVGAYATSKLYQLPSRKALTSGTLTKVPDESVFIKYLLNRLEDNEEKFLPVSQLFYSIRPAILNNSATVPQLGVIQNTGDEGGEFVFMRK